MFGCSIAALSFADVLVADQTVAMFVGFVEIFRT